MRVTWLPAVLRGAGLPVVEHTGWVTRGWEPWEPRYGIVHATAAPRTQSDADQVRIVRDGHSTLNGPIANCCVDRSGRWHVLASGRCNTALTGWAGPASGLGNTNLLGVEACNDNRGEPWPDVQYQAYTRGWAAICKRMGWPAGRCVGHKEHQPGDKSDPTFSMDTFRATVARLIEGDDMPLTDQDIAKTADAMYAKLVSPSSRVDLYDEAGKKRWRAGNSIGADSASFVQLLQWGGEVGHLTHGKVLPELATQRALLEQLLAQQSGLTEAQITAAVAAGVGAALDPDALADALAERIDPQIDRAAVAAALRDVLGSLDEA